jgi:hypothetical protein
MARKLLTQKGNRRMNTSPIIALAAIGLLLVLSQSSFAQSIRVSAPPYATGNTAVFWVDLNGRNDISSFRLMNFTTPSDPIKIRPVIVGESVIPFSVKLAKTDGSENIFYIYAFQGSNEVSGVFNPGSKIVIKSYKAPDGVENASVDQPVVNVVDGPGQPQKDTANNAAEPKLTAQAPAKISNQSTVSVQVNQKALALKPDTYEIEVKNSSGTFTPKSVAVKRKADNGFLDKQDLEVALKEGENTIKISPKSGSKVNDKAAAEINVVCDNCSDFVPSTSTRAVIGFEQLGASSANNKQSPFLEFYFDTPLTFGREPQSCEVGAQGCGTNGKKPPGRQATFSLWSKVRLSDVPVQRLVSFGSPTGFSNFLTGDNIPQNEFAQSFDFLVGLQSPKLLGGALGSGFFPGKSSVHAFFGVGAINPLATEKTAQIFKIPQVMQNGTMVNDPSFIDIFPEAKGKANIAFVTPERDKFFRQWFAGLRFKTNFYDGSSPAKMFPAMFDLAIGQNEAITQTLRGMVIKGDGSTPLPIKGGIISIFGSVQMRLGRKVDQRVQSLFLAPADAGVFLSSPGTAIVPIGRYPNTISNRDIFRLGIGVDIFRLFKATEEDKEDK